MGWQHFLDLVRDGEPVSAGTANRPIAQLDQNLRYLWDIIQTASLGSTVYARAQTVQNTLEVGQPVYFNAGSSRFEAAFATTVSDTETGYLVVADQAQVWGIVAKKLTANSADILLFGYAKIDLSRAIGTEVNLDGSVPAATWYLSGSGVGQLTQQQPPITVPVCKTTTDGGVFVNPKFIDFLENHRHYVFNLTMQPAGEVSPPIPGQPHAILAANAELPGWLPADHSSFNNTAPNGAKFGYNLNADVALRHSFPPIPLQSAAIIMQRPSVFDMPNEHKHYGQQLTPDLVVIDRNGIWWMRDCYDEVPWPTTLDTGSSASLSYADCDPAGRDYSLKLYFTRVGFATDNTSVASLRSRDSRLLVTCGGQQTSSGTGHLELALDLQFLLGSTDTAGFQVLKNFNPATNTFDSGPVCEGIFATTSNVVLTGDSQTLEDKQVFRGPVGIGVLSATSRELASQLVRLDGATEESFPVLYIGLPNDSQTSYVTKFEVPFDTPSSSTFRLRLRVLGRAAGTLPSLTVSYYTAGRPSNGLLVPINITQNYISLPIATAATLTANQAVEAVSSSIPVTAGDIVYCRVMRNPSDPADAYSGDVGIMQQVGILTTA